MHYTLITGASSGMGALCAKQLSSSRKLILASEDLERLQTVLADCSHPENHILWHCNFATERDEIADSLSYRTGNSFASVLKNLTVELTVHAGVGDKKSDVELSLLSDKAKLITFKASGMDKKPDFKVPENTLDIDDVENFESLLTNADFAGLVNRMKAAKIPEDYTSYANSESVLDLIEDIGESIAARKRNSYYDDYSDYDEDYGYGYGDDEDYGYGYDDDEDDDDDGDDWWGSYSGEDW